MPAPERVGRRCDRDGGGDGEHRRGARALAQGRPFGAGLHAREKC
jgi:hypothetical protein